MNEATHNNDVTWLAKNSRTTKSADNGYQMINTTAGIYHHTLIQTKTLHPRYSLQW